MSAISVEKMGTIDAGRQGENLARTIEFDVSSLLAKWPGAKITLLVKRKGDPEPYFADAKVEGHILKWPITGLETAFAGDGKIEIQAILGEVIEKSVTATFRVSASLSGSASEELPEVRPSWVDEVLAAAGGGGGGGSGEGVYIVTATRNSEGRLYADKSQEEIRAAVAAGLPCYLITDDGRVYSYYGEVYESAAGGNSPTFVGPARYESKDRVYFPRMHIAASMSVVSISATMPLPTGKNQHFVSNKNGAMQWEERTHYKEISTADVVCLAETDLVFSADPEAEIRTAVLLSPWLVEVVPNGNYIVTLNGTEYECPPLDLQDVEGAGMPAGVVALGNGALAEGVTGGNPDAPFCLVCVPNAVAPNYELPYAIMAVTGDIATATISVRGTIETVTYKPLDLGYIPEEVRNGGGRQITFTCDAEGNVTANATFEELWAMTNAQLQASVVVKQTGSYYGDPAAVSISGISVVTRHESNGDIWGYRRQLQFRFNHTIDFSDVLYTKERTHYISWVNGPDIGNILSIEPYNVDSLPNMNNADITDTEPLFLVCRYRSWQMAKADEIAAAAVLYITAQAVPSGSDQDVIDQIQNPSRTFEDIKAAVDAGRLCVLKLEFPDGSVVHMPLAVEMPADSYDDANFAFISPFPSAQLAAIVNKNGWAVSS